MHQGAAASTPLLASQIPRNCGFPLVAVTLGAVSATVLGVAVRRRRGSG
ncbi:MAG: hypothetical protein ACFFCO_07455 [Promethearchaeota archaeon]